MIFNAFSLALIGQLIVFHMSLQRNNLTTYEFIVRDHQLKRAVARREGDIEAHRVVRMAEAQRDGHKLAAWRLQMGGLCRQSGLVLCDPMDLPEIPGEPDPEAGFSQVLGNNTVKESNIDEGEEDEDDDDNNDEANSGHMQLSAHSSVAIYGTSSHNMSTNGEDNKKPEDGKTSDYINGESTYSSDQPLVDLMYEAGLTHGSVNQNEGPAIAVEDLDDPSSNDNDDSLEVDVDETTLVGSPLRNRELSPVAADSSEPNQPEEHDEEDDEVYEGIEAEMFDNEPDDVSYTSGCSGHSNRSPRKGNALGERDYTAF